MIVNIRGTSGSGKTYTVRALMKLFGDAGMTWDYRPGEKEQGGHRSGYHEGHASWRDRPVRVLGYYGGATCGGCDGIRTQLGVEGLLRAAVAEGADCVFEGLLISHLRSRWVVLPQELGVPWRFFFLDASLEACIQRAVDRRIARGDHRPFSAHNTTLKHRDIARRYDEFVAMGLDCRKVSSDNAPQEIYEYLNAGIKVPERPVRRLCFEAGNPPSSEGAGINPLDGGPDPRQISFL